MKMMDVRRSCYRYPLMPRGLWLFLFLLIVGGSLSAQESATRESTTDRNRDEGNWYEVDEWFDDKLGYQDDEGASQRRAMSSGSESDYNADTFEGSYISPYYATSRDFDSYDYDHDYYRQYGDRLYEDEERASRLTQQTRQSPAANLFTYEEEQSQRRPLQTISGEITGIRKVRDTWGEPMSVHIQFKTDSGKTRILHLGDLDYANQHLPRFREGEKVQIGGEFTDVDGQRMFQVKEIRSPQGDYRIPDYAYNQTLEGRLTNIRQVEARDGQVQAVIAEVMTDDGRTMDVLLGDEEDMRSQNISLRPNAEIAVRGYAREVDGKREFVIQDVEVDGRSTWSEERFSADRQEQSRRSERTSSESESRSTRSSQSTESRSESIQSPDATRESSTQRQSTPQSTETRESPSSTETTGSTPSDREGMNLQSQPERLPSHSIRSGTAEIRSGTDTIRSATE